jgi:hypothetical protein
LHLGSALLNLFPDLLVGSGLDLLLDLLLNRIRVRVAQRQWNTAPPGADKNLSGALINPEFDRRFGILGGYLLCSCGASDDRDDDR